MKTHAIAILAALTLTGCVTNSPPDPTYEIRGGNTVCIYYVQDAGSRQIVDSTDVCWDGLPPDLYRTQWVSTDPECGVTEWVAVVGKVSRTFGCWPRPKMERVDPI